jgi:hypothetical protein
LQFVTILPFELTLPQLDDQDFVLLKGRRQPVNYVFGINIQLQAHKSKNPIANAGVSINSVVARGGVDQSLRVFNPSSILSGSQFMV